MKKADVVKEMKERTGLTKTQIEEFFEQYANVVEDGLDNNDKVPFPKLGSFQMKKKAARGEREARNPRTGEKILVAPKPAYLTPIFKPNKNFKQIMEVELEEE